MGKNSSFKRHHNGSTSSTSASTSSPSTSPKAVKSRHRHSKLSPSLSSQISLPSSKYLNSLSPAKATFLILSITACSVFLLHCFQVFQSSISQLDHGVVEDSPSNNQSDLGGWRPPSAEVWAKYGSSICNIERISVVDLSPERFESEVRFKKPIIVTFPNGARDWTVPEKWSKAGLVKAYSKWTIHSGESLEIVRKGGNGRHATSFLDFINNQFSAVTNVTQEPAHYAFDRQFYWHSDLPKTLHLPEYFVVNVTRDESIFFLGSSMTGVVFHKHSDTWNGVVYGQKRWFLYPNTRTPPGGVHHGFTLLDWVNRIYPNLTEGERPTECVQGPGEILYLPEGTYHATLNLGDTVAVAIQRREATIEAEKISYEATKLTNFLQEKQNADPKNSFNERLLQVYRQWLELLPESAEAMMKIGYVLYSMGDYKESLPYHMGAIKLDPYFIVAYLHLANTFAELGQHERAEKTYKKAIEISPNLWDSYKEYGEYLLKQGRHADALPVYKKGTELMPDMVPFWFYYKLCQQAVGDHEGAEASEKIIVDLKIREELGG